MDIERAIEFILDQQAKAAEAHRRLEEQLAEAQARYEERQAKAEERQAKAEERQAKAEELQVNASARHDREMDRIDSMLRRAVRLGIQEARAERKKRQEMDRRWDEKMTQLAAAQLITEEKLQNFIASQGRSTNGGPPKQ
jgi:hypothetical protein